MRNLKRPTSTSNRALIGLSLLASLALSSQAICQTPDSVRLYGVIRDFQKTNADFVVVPNGGYGHYAGNVALTISGNGRPVFTGNGFRVQSEWRNAGNKPIPPHLFLNGGTAVITTSSAPAIGTGCTVDSFDPTEGPYGGGNIGPAPSFAYPAAMPTITIPASLQSLPNQNNVTYNGTQTLAANLHCNNVTVKGTLKINGNVNILCENSFGMNTNATVSLNPGATLNIYTKGAGSSWNHVTVGDPADPTRVHIYHTGTSSYMIHNHADVFAIFVSPNAALELNNHGELFGQFIGLGLNIGNQGGIHIMGTPPPPVCGVTMNDTPGNQGINSNGGIPSSSVFNSWYSDSLGVNLSASHPIDLIKNASGVFEYLADNFHPIDNMLYGNQEQDHNYYFTYALDAQFVHDACAGKFIEFEGNDDVWVFINGQLAMDIGGVKPGTPQFLEIDRMANLTDGATCTIQLFYAQRQTSDAVFRLRTNLDLVGTPTNASVSASCD